MEDKTMVYDSLLDRPMTCGLPLRRIIPENEVEACEIWLAQETSGAVFHSPRFWDCLLNNDSSEAPPSDQQRKWIAKIGHWASEMLRSRNQELNHIRCSLWEKAKEIQEISEKIQGV